MLSFVFCLTITVWSDEESNEDIAMANINCCLLLSLNQLFGNALQLWTQLLVRRSFWSFDGKFRLVLVLNESVLPLIALKGMPFKWCIDCPLIGSCFAINRCPKADICSTDCQSNWCQNDYQNWWHSCPVLWAIYWKRRPIDRPNDP